MGTGFASIPSAPRYRLTNARAPATLVIGTGLAADRDGLTLLDITIENGRIVSVIPAGTFSLDGDLPSVDLDGGMVWPTLRRQPHASRQGPHLAAPPQP